MSNVITSQSEKSNITLTLDDLSEAPIWVAWQEATDGKKKPLSPTTGNAAKSNDPKTWGTRKAAEKHAQRLQGDRPSGIGINIAPVPRLDGWRLCGVDLDGCIDPKTGKIALWAKTIIDRFETYAEYSPSGTGIHVVGFCRDDDVQALRDAELVKNLMRNFGMGEHLEIKVVFGGLYFTVTKDHLGDDPTIRPVELADLEWLLRDHGPATRGKITKKSKSQPTGGDESGSGIGFKFLCDCFREGMSEDEARDAISEDEGNAGSWWHRAGERQQDRAVENARARIDEEQDGYFDNLETEGDEADAESANLLGITVDEFLAEFRESEPDAQEDEFELDEDGVIRAFTTTHTGELRFDHSAGGWFRFDGNSWRREETKLAHHYARKLATGMAEDDPKAKALRKVNVWEAIERGARTVREFVATADNWNRDPWLLGTPRGTVDLRTGVLRPGAPEDGISRLTAAAPVPLDDFDPEHECPRWLAFLDEALGGDAEAIRFLQMWGGYSLTGVTKEHALVFVYGPGGSGKSTAVNTMADILGEYAINVATSTLTAAKHDAHPEEIARLDGARLTWASETEKGRAWAENRIKALTGGDKMTARFMRQNSFEFTPQMKLMIVGNNAPSLTNVDEAIKRRFIILPFDHPPKSKDPNLPEKLRAEWSGILSWMIEGCLNWQANGLVRPEVAVRATDAYFDEQDVFAQWIEDCCETGKRCADTTADLWKSWYAYAWENGEDPGTKKRSFPESLSQRGFDAIKNRYGIRGRGYRGIQVDKREQSDDEDIL